MTATPREQARITKAIDAALTDLRQMLIDEELSEIIDAMKKAEADYSGKTTFTFPIPCSLTLSPVGNRVDTTATLAFAIRRRVTANNSITDDPDMFEPEV